MTDTRTMIDMVDPEDELERKKRKAEEYLNDPKKLKELVDKAQKKAQEQKGPLSEIIEEVHALYRLVSAYIKGEYRDVSWESMVIIIGALLYFITPLDVIPDFIPVAGLLDDAAVLGFAIKSVRGELERFLEWEQEHGKH